jgi:hypothetical protein
MPMGTRPQLLALRSAVVCIQPIAQGLDPARAEEKHR